jgi:signal transduction histidine kinase
MLAGIERYRDNRILVNVRRERPLATMGNEAELKQVLLNLAVNALEAIEPGTGWVRIDVERHGDQVLMSVIDNGVGMTPDVLEHVFEPFFTKRAETGARGVGLGLSVSYAIIESHGGRLLAYSEGPGRGSRFVMELPAANGDEHDSLVSIARGEPARANR